MIRCTINGSEFTYPSKWDELSRHNLSVIARGFVKELSVAEFRIQTLLKFIGLKISVRDAVYLNNEKLYQLRTADKKKAFLSGAQLVEMADKLSFITKEIKDEHDNTVYALDSKLTINLVPTFRHRLSTYYGPADKLFNISFVEYITAEGFFNEYVKTKDPLQLDKLVATLYRKRNRKVKKNSLTYRGDLRQPFNDHLVDAYAKKLRHLSPEIKTAIALFYEGCRAFLQQQFKDVFKSATPGRSSGVPAMLALVDALTAGDVTKTEQVRNSYLYDVMVHLQKAIENQEEMEAKMKQKNKKQ